MRIKSTFVVCGGCGQSEELKAKGGELVDPTEWISCSHCQCLIFINTKTVFHDRRPVAGKRRRDWVDLSCSTCSRTTRISKCSARAFLRSGTMFIFCSHDQDHGQIPLELPHSRKGSRFRSRRTSHDLIAAGRAC